MGQERILPVQGLINEAEIMAAIIPSFYHPQGHAPEGHRPAQVAHRRPFLDAQLPSPVRERKPDFGPRLQPHLTAISILLRQSKERKLTHSGGKSRVVVSVSDTERRILHA
jgi:hypothetical protein